jgi:predicted chitinase
MKKDSFEDLTFTKKGSPVFPNASLRYLLTGGMIDESAEDDAEIEESLRAERQRIKDQKKAGWGAALNILGTAAGAAAGIPGVGSAVGKFFNADSEDPAALGEGILGGISGGASVGGTIMSLFNKMGGHIKTSHLNNGLLELNGDSHEEASGGIDMTYPGSDARILVEDGETVFNDFVFTNSRDVPVGSTNEFLLPKAIEGKSFAKASKILAEDSSMNSNDPKYKKSFEIMMGRLQSLHEQAVPESREENQEASALNAMVQGQAAFKYGGDYKNLLGSGSKDKGTLTGSVIDYYETGGNKGSAASRIKNPSKQSPKAAPKNEPPSIFELIRSGIVKSIEDVKKFEGLLGAQSFNDLPGWKGYLDMPSFNELKELATTGKIPLKEGSIGEMIGDPLGIGKTGPSLPPGFVEKLLPAQQAFDEGTQEINNRNFTPKLPEDLGGKQIAPGTPVEETDPYKARTPFESRAGVAGSAASQQFNLNPTQFKHMEQMMNGLTEQGISPRLALAISSVGFKESGFRPTSEVSYRNTSNDRIRSIFKKTRDLTDEQLDDLKSSDEQFFDYVYKTKALQKSKNEDGSDHDPEPGDGYNYRGRGIIQLTGRRNYQNLSQAVFGDDRLVEDPDLVNDPRYAGRIAAGYLTSKSMGKPITEYLKEAGIDPTSENVTQEQVQKVMDGAYAKVAGRKALRNQDGSLKVNATVFEQGMGKMQGFVNTNINSNEVFNKLDLKGAPVKIQDGKEVSAQAGDPQAERRQVGQISVKPIKGFAGGEEMPDEPVVEPAAPAAPAEKVVAEEPAVEKPATEEPVVQKTEPAAPSELADLPQDSILRYAPLFTSAGQTLAAAFEKPTVRDRKTYNVKNTDVAETLNVDPMLAALNETEASGRQSLVSNITDSGQLMASLLSLSSNMADKRSKVAMDKQMFDTNQLDQLAQSQARVDLANQQAEFQTDAANDANLAAYSDNLNTALVGLAQNVGNLGQEISDRNILKKINPFGPDGEIVNPGALPYFYSMLTGQTPGTETEVKIDEEGKTTTKTTTGDGS